MARTQLLHPIAAGLVDGLRVDDQRERVDGLVVEQERHLQARTRRSQPHEPPPKIQTVGWPIWREATWNAPCADRPSRTPRLHSCIAEARNRNEAIQVSKRRHTLPRPTLRSLLAREKTQTENGGTEADNPNRRGRQDSLEAGKARAAALELVEEVRHDLGQGQRCAHEHPVRRRGCARS